MKKNVEIEDLTQREIREVITLLLSKLGWKITFDDETNEVYLESEYGKNGVTAGDWESTQW